MMHMQNILTGGKKHCCDGCKWDPSRTHVPCDWFPGPEDFVDPAYTCNHHDAIPSPNPLPAREENPVSEQQGRMRVKEGGNDGNDIDQKMLLLLDKWAKLLMLQKTTREDMARVRNQITSLMTSDSMTVGKFQLSKHKNYNDHDYFTNKKKMDNREFTWVLQIRMRMKKNDAESTRR